MISFIVAGLFWFSHHRLFHYVRMVDGPLLWLNILYLGFVSLMPFSSALAGEYSRMLFSQWFYSSNMILLALLGLMKYRYVFRHPELWATPVTLAFSAGALPVDGLDGGRAGGRRHHDARPRRRQHGVHADVPISILSRRGGQRAPEASADKGARRYLSAWSMTSSVSTA
jgi:hypothetical protein